MAKVTIPLGDLDRVSGLYSYPNQPKASGTLQETILHWFSQTLKRDGLKQEGASASVRIEGKDHFLDLDGPPSVQDDLRAYAERLPRFLDCGYAALSVTEVLKTTKPAKPWPKELGARDTLWDPMSTGRWRFFLPLGLAMIRHRALNVLYYPPIRLLEETRDYLSDPVPIRMMELATANGAPRLDDVFLYQTVVDIAPIAADDDQGTFPFRREDGELDYVHLISSEPFDDYQRGQIQLLLNISSEDNAWTVPIAVYGTSARSTFERLYNVKLETGKATTTSIIRGKVTPVIASGHPYAFYPQIQTPVGSGKIDPAKCAAGVKVMINDLIIAGWLRRMAANPSQDGNAMVDQLTAYWNSPEQRPKVCALVQHQGSLYYRDCKALEFTYRLSHSDAAKWCTDNDSDPCTHPMS